MSTSTWHTPSAELELALVSVLAGHHDPRQAGRERAARTTSRLTMTLAALAAVVMTYNAFLLIA